MIGQKLAHYTVLDRLGAGGMGEVYLARDERLGREVALKILPKEFSADEKRVARFNREAKLASALSHTNIATIYEAGEEEGQHFIAMELVKGETLTAKVKPGGLKLDEILDIAIPLAEGLAEAHEAGVVHRDLKPGNVMLDAKGRVKILDFGLSRPLPESDLVTAGLTTSGTVMGTPHYMAPEQMRGEETDGRSDLFTLGVILYELATGARPFEGDSLAVVMQSVLRGEPTPLVQARPNLGELFGHVVDRLLEKDVDRRFQTADDLVSELRCLQKPSTRIHKEPRRKVPVALIATVALLAMGSAYAILYGLGVDSGKTEDIPRLVVLPFKNLGTPDDELLADGITEEISRRLSVSAGLRVINHRSAMRYKDLDKSTREIARDLDVGYILEGTVRTQRSPGSEGLVRVLPRLVRTSDDTQLWADSVDVALDVSNLFEVQARIAADVSKSLGIRLSALEREDLEAKPTESYEAWGFYLRGNQYLEHEFAGEDLSLAVAMYGKAIEADPDFALAYAKLAQAHVRKYWSFLDHSDERLALAKQALDEASRLAPDLPETHAAKGWYFYHGLSDYDRGLAEFELAHARLPNSGDAHKGIAYVLRRKWRIEEALESFLEALELEPDSALLHDEIGLTYKLLWRFDEALEHFEAARDLNPQGVLPLRNGSELLRSAGLPDQASEWLDAAPAGLAENAWLVNARFSTRLMQRRFDEALAEISTASFEAADSQSEYLPRSLLEARVYELVGRTAQARESYAAARSVLESKLRDAPTDFRIHAALGLVLAGLGEEEEAVRAGRKARELVPISVDAIKARYVLEDLAAIYAKVGRFEAALDELDFLIEKPSTLTPAMLRLDPIWDPLRAHPRFERLLARE